MPKNECLKCKILFVSDNVSDTCASCYSTFRKKSRIPKRILHKCSLCGNNASVQNTCNKCYGIFCGQHKFYVDHKCEIFKVKKPVVKVNELQMKEESKKKNFGMSCLYEAFQNIFTINPFKISNVFSDIDSKVKDITYQTFEKEYGKKRQLYSDYYIIGNMARCIVKGLVTEKEKAYAIYSWIIQHIKYDRKSYENDNYAYKQNCATIITTGTAVCSGYANLYVKLCSEVKLECIKIQGITHNTKPGSPGHAWNAVKFENKLHLIDSCWGVSHPSKYFDAPPLEFIKTHFPEAIVHQYLENPISKKDFLEKHSLYKNNLG